MNQESLALILEDQKLENMSYAYREMALRGFVFRYMTGEEILDPIREEYLDYIRNHRRSLWRERPFRRVILSEGFITAQDMDQFQAQAELDDDRDFLDQLQQYRILSMPRWEQHRLEQFRRPDRAEGAPELNSAQMKKIWPCRRLGDGSWEIVSYRGSDRNVVIPSSIGKSPVSAVGPGAFSPTYAHVRQQIAQSRRAITSISVPKGIRRIEAEAFAGCSSLTRIVLSRSVEFIGKGAFRSCSNLYSIVLPPGLTKISMDCFRDCTHLSYISIPRGVTEIQDNAFSGCAALTRVSLPDTLIQIGAGAFHCCRRLTGLHIPDTLQEIGEYAFRECTSITRMRLPKGLQSIANGTFSGCTGLTRIAIPRNVTQIGDYAFFRCNQITSIVIPAGVRFIGESAFRECASLESVNYLGRHTDTASTAFYDSPKFTFRAPAGGYALVWSKRHVQIRRKE